MHVHTIKLKDAVYKTANDLADSEKDLFQEEIEKIKALHFI
mgnify:CR=1 FL=1